MTLLLDLGPTILTRETCSHGIGVVYEFVKLIMIPAVCSENNFHANIFGTNDESEAFQDNRPKNDHPLGVPLLTSYAIELH